MNILTFDDVLTQFKSLSPVDKIRLMQEMMNVLRQEIQTQPVEEDRQRWYGMCADLGPAPSAEDIDEVRREMWKSFPREDI
jgi:hypothetical protein